MIYDGYPRFRYGQFVATHPKKVMAVALFSVILCSLGLINFNSEADANRLLYAQDSDFVKNKEWRSEHYEDNLRVQYAMLGHDSNVLNRNGLLKLLKLYQIFHGVEVEGKRFSDICLTTPIVNANLGPQPNATEDVGATSRRRRQTEEPLEVTDADVAVTESPAANATLTTTPAANETDFGTLFKQGGNTKDISPIRALFWALSQALF